MPKLTPPDLNQCQAEKPNGYSFMTLGGRPGLERCTNKPLVVATEVHPGPDGQKGSMSLCSDCLRVLNSQMPGSVTVEMSVLLPKGLHSKGAVHDPESLALDQDIVRRLVGILDAKAAPPSPLSEGVPEEQQELPFQLHLRVPAEVDVAIKQGKLPDLIAGLYEDVQKLKKDVVNLVGAVAQLEESLNTDNIKCKSCGSDKLPISGWCINCGKG